MSIAVFPNNGETVQRKDEISMQSLKQLQQLRIFGGHCIREVLIDLHSDRNDFVTETILNVFGRCTLFRKHGLMGVMKTVISACFCVP